jgi:hypothetical protein
MLSLLPLMSKEWVYGWRGIQGGTLKGEAKKFDVNVEEELMHGTVAVTSVCHFFFNCCLSVYVDNYTIIVPTIHTSLLKAQYITICTFLSSYS